MQTPCRDGAEVMRSCYECSPGRLFQQFAFMDQNQPILFTPGPTQIPARVLDAMSVANLHHRTPEFEGVFKEVSLGLQKLFNFDNPAILLAASGTGGMESALLNLCGRKDKILYINAGKFGERWGEIANACGMLNIEFRCDWGQTVDLTTLRELLENNTDITVVCMQHCETSTTVLHPIREICLLVKDVLPDALTVVDAISSALSSPIDTQKDQIDLLIMGSQKAFMLPPGLVMIGLSKDALQRCKQTPCPSLYFNLELEQQTQVSGVSAWTPATTLILGLAEVQKIIEELGVTTVWERHRAYHGFFDLLLSSFALSPINRDYPSLSVTGFTLPEGTSTRLLRNELLKAGFLVAGGQDQWKDKVIRIGHMGIYTKKQLLSFAHAFKSIVVRQLGLKQAQPIDDEIMLNFLDGTNTFNSSLDAD